jgi:hypothetical protein
VRTVAGDNCRSNSRSRQKRISFGSGIRTGQTSSQRPQNVEAFGLTGATKIWRRMFESEDQLARDGLAFMKKHAGK